jgi:hypothetical protein
VDHRRDTGPNTALKDRLGINMMRVIRAWLHGQAAEEIPMYQRAIPVHPHIAAGEMPGVRAPLNARTRFRAFVDHSLRLMRWLGEFAAAGGALS